MRKFGNFNVEFQLFFGSFQLYFIKFFWKFSELKIRHLVELRQVEIIIIIYNAQNY